jgi:hypothetical protein
MNFIPFIFIIFAAVPSKNLSKDYEELFLKHSILTANGCRVLSKPAPLTGKKLVKDYCSKLPACILTSNISGFFFFYDDSNA